eukprot:8875984-Pyramimonas_sp.AAC.1
MKTKRYRMDTTHEPHKQIEYVIEKPPQGKPRHIFSWERCRTAHLERNKLKIPQNVIANEIINNVTLHTRLPDNQLTLCNHAMSVPQELAGVAAEAEHIDSMQDDASLSEPAGSEKRDREQMEEGETEGAVESRADARTGLSHKIGALSTTVGTPMARGTVTDGQLTNQAVLMQYLADISLEDEPAQGLTYGEILKESGRRSKYGIQRIP